MHLFPRAGRLAALAAVALLPSLASAQDTRAGDLVIQTAWARATPNGAQVAGGYLTVVNHGSVPDALTGGSLAVADKAEVHAMAVENGVMTMRPTGPVEIPPGGSVTFAPSGRHIMFSGLRRGLMKGEEVAGTLVFAHAGTVPVRFMVEGIGARAPSARRGGQAMPGMDAD